MSNLFLLAQDNTFMVTMIIITVLVVIAFLGFVLLLIKQYKRCPSNRVLVIYGRTSKGGAARTVHGGASFASFPSGHMSVTLAAMTCLWFFYPKFRWLYSLIALCVAIGLLLMNYHFLSDVIAGSYLGFITAYFALQLSASTASDKQ